MVEVDAFTGWCTTVFDKVDPSTIFSIDDLSSSMLLTFHNWLGYIHNCLTHSAIIYNNVLSPVLPLNRSDAISIINKFLSSLGWIGTFKNSFNNDKLSSSFSSDFRNMFEYYVTNPGNNFYDPVNFPSVDTVLPFMPRWYMRTTPSKNRPIAIPGKRNPLQLTSNIIVADDADVLDVVPVPNIYTVDYYAAGFRVDAAGPTVIGPLDLDFKPFSPSYNFNYVPFSVRVDSDSIHYRVEPANAPLRDNKFSPNLFPDMTVPYYLICHKTRFPIHSLDNVRNTFPRVLVFLYTSDSYLSPRILSDFKIDTN